MTKAYTIGSTRVVELCPEPASKCELCGKAEETRPYGPNGEHVCFECGMKDEETAKRQFDKLLHGNH